MHLAPAQIPASPATVKDEALPGLPRLLDAEVMAEALR